MANAAGEAILFIAGIAMAAAFIGAASTAVQQMATGTRMQGENAADVYATDLAIINDAQRITTNPHVFYVKNTGAATLATADLTVLWDGQVATSVTADVLTSTDDTLLLPGQVVKLTASGLSTSAGDHAVAVVAHNGVSDSLEVRI